MPIETKNAGLVVQISVYARAGVPCPSFGGWGLAQALGSSNNVSPLFIVLTKLVNRVTL